MIPAPFDYEVADSVEHAVELLGSREDAKLLAGGHSLLPLLRLRFTRPALLVDIGRIDDLRYVRDAGDTLAIGGMTRHHNVQHDPLLQEHCPVLSYAAGLIGDPQVRHRGTIGGSLAHADPAGDVPAVLTALDAEVVMRADRACRRVRHGRLRHRARGSGRRDGDPRAEAGAGRLVVPEVHAPRAGLGHRRRDGNRPSLEWVGGQLGDRVHEHGPAAGPRDGGGTDAEIA